MRLVQEALKGNDTGCKRIICYPAHCLCEFVAAGFIATACVHPKVLQTITLSPIPAELYFAVASFVLGCAIHHIVKGNLLRFPSVRKDDIPGNVISKELNKAEFAAFIVF